jgi:hypothetical protein
MATGSFVKRNGIRPDSDSGRAIAHLLTLPDGTRMTRAELSHLFAATPGGKIDFSRAVAAGLVHLDVTSPRKSSVWIADRQGCVEALDKGGVALQPEKVQRLKDREDARFEAFAVLAGARVLAILDAHRAWRGPRRPVHRLGMREPVEVD